MRLVALTTLATLTSAVSMADLNLSIEERSLDNGLRVVLNEDHTAPTVAIAVYYDVGSKDESPGRTGFAHLFEHMMFQGSKNVPKFGHIQFVQRVGGVVNGTTSHDRTNYFEQVPSNYLEYVLWLEADRMRSLALTKDNFENQRDTVKEERRQSYDNRPYAKSFLRINELAFENFPYEHSTIGRMEDLDAAPLEAVQEFFDTYYRPNNALLSISGDFEPEAAIALAKKHFGDIQRGKDAPHVIPVEPPQQDEKSEIMEDALARLPAFFLAWHIPADRKPDTYALEVLATVLGDGKSSRLYRKLIDEKKVAQSVSVDRDHRRGPDLFNVWCVLQEGAKAPDVRDLILKEIASIAKKGISKKELAKAHNRIRARFTFGLQGALHRALRIAEYALYHGDADLIKTESLLFDKVTREDVQRVAQKYFDARNRTYLEVQPKAAQ